MVLNYELRDVLLDCLASLERAVGPNDEIILVDNASTDDSVAAVRAAFPDVRIVENATNRYIFGLNDGLAVARGRYVAFCNNDMTVEDDFVEALARLLRCRRRLRRLRPHRAAGRPGPRLPHGRSLEARPHLLRAVGPPDR